MNTNPEPSHGHLVRPGDEFNLEAWYHCRRCHSAHAISYSGCEGLLYRPWGTEPEPAPTPLSDHHVELVAKWLEKQRTTLPATGPEFAAALRFIGAKGL